MGLVVVLAVVAVGIGLYLVNGKSTTSTTAPSPSASSVPTTTPTTEPPPPTGIALQAAMVGVQPRDLENLPGIPNFTRGPGEFTSDQSNPIAARHSAPGSSAPLSGASWLADEESILYSNYEGNLNVSSDVLFMPNGSQAQATLNAINTPNYGVQCYQPTMDSQFKSGASAGGKQCGLVFRGSQIAQLPLGTVPAPLTGYRYQANIYCSTAQQSTTVYVDLVDQVVGSTFLQLRVSTFGALPPASLEESVMAAMAGRASSGSY